MWHLWFFLPNSCQASSQFAPTSTCASVQSDPDAHPQNRERKDTPAPVKPNCVWICYYFLPALRLVHRAPSYPHRLQWLHLFPRLFFGRVFRKEVSQRSTYRRPAPITSNQRIENVHRFMRFVNMSCLFGAELKNVCPICVHHCLEILPNFGGVIVKLLKEHAICDFFVSSIFKKIERIAMFILFSASGWEYSWKELRDSELVRLQLHCS